MLLWRIFVELPEVRRRIGYSYEYLPSTEWQVKIQQQQNQSQHCVSTFGTFFSLFVFAIVPQQPTFLYNDFISNISQIEYSTPLSLACCLVTSKKRTRKMVRCFFLPLSQGFHTHRLSTFSALNFCNTFELNRFQNTSSNRINRTQFRLMLLLFSFAFSVCFLLLLQIRLFFTRSICVSNAFTLRFRVNLQK